MTETFGPDEIGVSLAEWRGEKSRLANASVLLEVGKQLWSAVLVGNPSPFVAALSDRMRHPRPGDIVVELSGYTTGATRRVGRLLRKVREPLPYWDADDEPNPGEPVWYIQTDAGEVRWVNADFVAIIGPDWPR